MGARLRNRQAGPLDPQQKKSEENGRGREPSDKCRYFRPAIMTCEGTSDATCVYNVRRTVEHEIRMPGIRSMALQARSGSRADDTGPRAVDGIRIISSISSSLTEACRS